MEKGFATIDVNVVPTDTHNGETGRALQIAAQNGASVEPSVDGLSLPTIRVAIENGELVFRDYTAAIDPSGKCAVIAQIGGDVNTSITLCQRGARSIEVTGIGNPTVDIGSQVSAPLLSFTEPGTGSSSGVSVGAEEETAAGNVTGFTPAETRFLAVFNKDYFEVSKSQFAELLKSGADFDTAVKVGKEFTEQYIENQRKIDELNQEFDRIEAVGGLPDVEDSRVKERNALEETNKQIAFKLDGTERYIAHLIRERNGGSDGAGLQARLGIASRSGESQGGENAGGEPSPEDSITETYSQGRSQSSSWDSTSRDIFSDIAKLLVTGAGYANESQVESAISDLGSKHDLVSLSAAINTFTQIIKQHPEFAGRVDSVAVAELAKCFGEFANPNSPENALRFLDSETIDRLPLSGLGSLSTSEVRTIFGLLRDASPTTYVDNGTNGLDFSSQ